LARGGTQFVRDVFFFPSFWLPELPRVFPEFVGLFSGLYRYHPIFPVITPLFTAVTGENDFHAVTTVFAQ
jgi:hypothetical protein